MVGSDVQGSQLQSTGPVLALSTAHSYGLSLLVDKSLSCPQPGRVSHDAAQRSRENCPESIPLPGHAPHGRRRCSPCCLPFRGALGAEEQRAFSRAVSSTREVCDLQVLGCRSHRA